MQRMKITAGHQQVMPYLTVVAAENYIDFLKKIFNAQEILRKVDAQHKIEISEMIIGDSTLMITEETPANSANPTALFTYVKDADQTYYDALDAGATAIMTPIDEDDATRSAGFKDPFGNTWWIATLH